MHNDFAAAVLTRPDIVLGDLRRRFGPEIGPVHADEAPNRVGLLLDAVHDRFVALGRGLEDVAAGVVQPAVISAGDASLLDATIEQRSAAVGAVIPKQANAAELITEEHQVFA